MAHIDYKVTTWRKIYVPDEKMQEVIEVLVTNPDAYTIYETMDVHGVYDISDEADCEEPMLPEENNGMSTIEMYDNNGQLVFENAPEKE